MNYYKILLRYNRKFYQNIRYFIFQLFEISDIMKEIKDIWNNLGVKEIELRIPNLLVIFSIEFAYLLLVEFVLSS
jgi:hypothetical protein